MLVLLACHCFTMVPTFGEEAGGLSWRRARTSSTVDGWNSTATRREGASLRVQYPSHSPAWRLPPTDSKDVPAQPRIAQRLRSIVVRRKSSTDQTAPRPSDRIAQESVPPNPFIEQEDQSDPFETADPPPVDDPYPALEELLMDPPANNQPRSNEPREVVPQPDPFAEPADERPALEQQQRPVLRQPPVLEQQNSPPLPIAPFEQDTSRESQEDYLLPRPREPQPAPMAEELLPDGDAAESIPDAFAPSYPFDQSPLPRREAVADTGNADCEEKLIALRESRIRGINLNIRVDGVPGVDFPAECALGQSEFRERDWPQVTYLWKASAVCHKPLYFEQVAAERYGHSAGPVLQPLISGAHFFTSVVVLPYKMGLRTPNECVYVLGYYRPGNCAPRMLPGIPFSPRAGLFQAGAVVGLAAALP